MFKEYLLDEQMKESALTFHIMGRKKKAQSGASVGPRSHSKDEGKVTRRIMGWAGLCHMLTPKQQ